MTEDISLYIHIPFCKSRCMYCNFLTFANKSRWIPDYVDSLCVEIKKRARKFKNAQVETIYFGGGTPSLINPLLIRKIIQQSRACFSIKDDVEITIECNPESVDENRLKIYKDAGVTRFSLGVQSLNKETLARIARPHDSKTIFASLDCFKNAGIKDFGTDFIMGLPGQTFASFQSEVETLLEFNPAHLSFYFLSHDTPKIDSFIKECPDEDEQIAMYNWLCKRLNDSGFVHYEVSNWARPGFECRHNKRYWEQKDYLGIGLGAHSIVKGGMWENQKDFESYLRDPMQTLEHMKIDPDLRRMEYIMLGLRTNIGIDLKKYGALGDTKELMKNAAPYIKSGCLRKTGHSELWRAGRGGSKSGFAGLEGATQAPIYGENRRLMATEKGFLILDKITERLI